MQNNTKLTISDAIYFLDMVGSKSSPNSIPGMYKRKPYNKLLSNRDSNEFKRFIWIYNEYRYVLSEREKYILDEIYGLNKEGSTRKSVGQHLNITIERVRQILFKAERKIVTEILKEIKLPSK